MRKRNTIISTALFLILILFVFISITLLTSFLKQETPATQSGYADLTNFDFSEKLAYISNTSFQYYKSAYYTPADFLSKKVTQAPVNLQNVQGRFDPGNYGTYRIVLALPTDATYGFSAYSAMYSQRLFINGKEYPAVGIPGTTAETTVPKTNHCTVYFTPAKEQTEIIIQFANFNHYDYGGAFPFYIGAQEKITERDAIAQQRVHILAGCTITAFLFFFGMFFFFKRRYAFLWFSLACFAVGLRLLIIDEKVIMLLIPGLSWNMSIGVEYIALILLLLTALLYLRTMFPGALPKPAIWAFGTLCALFALAVLLTEPIIYTRFMLWFEVSAMLFGIYVIIALIYSAVRKKENRRAENLLIFVGAFVFIILANLDMHFHRTGWQSLAIGLSEFGMIVFIFVNMVALALQFSHTEVELDKALRSEREMQETNQLQDKLGQLKSDFLANISHEMRTPLTIMASYAGLTSMQIRHNAIDEKTLTNLDIIKREAIRLAGLVEQLKEVSLEKERQLALTQVEGTALLQEAANFCEPICLKNKNHILVCENQKPITLRVNEESIFQTLVNLIINANRHTNEGTIRLNIEESEPGPQAGFVTITVLDNGEGIDPQLLPSLFQRGVSGDGSTGLGLAICKEIIEEHGGKCSIKSERGKWTAVSIILPQKKGSSEI